MGVTPPPIRFEDTWLIYTKFIMLTTNINILGKKICV
jgi:hypothetical protein